MSTLSIANYFPYPRVRVVGQSVCGQAVAAEIELAADRRFRPLCHVCQRAAAAIHSCGHRRFLRDLNLATAEVWLRVGYRKVWCEHCGGVRVEHLSFCDASKRITRRLERYLHELCKVLPVKTVAEHLGLDIKTVRAADRAALESHFGGTNYRGLQYLAIDEIALRKGDHNDSAYMTVVLDYLTGRIVWMGPGHSSQTLDRFFAEMPDPQKQQIEAVAMDMWAPFIKAVGAHCPDAAIVFDFFHVVQQYGKVIDSVRRSEYRQAMYEHRPVFQGTRYLLLKNADKLTEPQQARLGQLLELNTKLSAVYVLKDQLREIYRYGDRVRAKGALDAWCAMAREVDHPMMDRFVRMLRRHEYGILNHCEYPIGTSLLEGVNNKLKVLKRRAYGFHDPDYFALKAKQAFPGKPTTNFIG